MRRVLALLICCAALLAGLASYGTASSASHARQPANVPAGYPELLASQVLLPIPSRNLYGLTDALRLRPPRRIPMVVSTKEPDAPNGYPVGHQERFHVLSEDNNNYFTVTATIVAESAHMYLFVQNGTKVDPKAARTAVNYFEDHVYPTDRGLYGSEWRPGVDGDPHIFALYADLRSGSTAGAFSAEDEYPRIVNPYSNQHEMIYLNSQAGPPDGSVFYDLVSHEFQHMIHWHVHPHDNAWLNEGMSVLAEYVNGFHSLPSGYVDDFRSLPDTQLNDWSLNDARWSAHYGAAFLYLGYLYNRFGRSLIHAIENDSRYTDYQAIDDSLRKLGINTSADTLFGQWVVANYLRDGSIAHGIYTYPEFDGSVHAGKTVTPPFTLTSSVQPYAAQYVVLNNLSSAKPFQFSLQTPVTVPATSLGGRGPFWWSNKGDMSDMRLQRSVNLRSVHRATLQYDVTYDIEKDYDYAYVEASVDGGKTWTALHGTHTTNANPYGAGYGNGYTGSYRSWRHETVDLTPYAGKRMLLRFEYITDDEYNGQGMVIRNIAIPQLGFRDNYSGWKVQGWVPVLHNTLPATWHLELIRYGTRGPSVIAMSVSNGHGSLTVNPARLHLQKAVAVVYVTAPRTTVSSSYTLSASPTS